MRQPGPGAWRRGRALGELELRRALARRGAAGVGAPGCVSCLAAWRRRPRRRRREARRDAIPLVSAAAQEWHSSRSRGASGRHGGAASVHSAACAGAFGGIGRRGSAVSRDAQPGSFASGSRAGLNLGFLPGLAGEPAGGRCAFQVFDLTAARPPAPFRRSCQCLSEATAMRLPSARRAEAAPRSGRGRAPSQRAPSRKPNHILLSRRAGLWKRADAPFAPA